MVDQLMDVILAYVNRHKIVLTDRNRRVQPKTVNLHWWSMFGTKQNVGDYLSTVVVDYMTKYYHLASEPSLKKTQHLYAIGSIIDGGYQNATIWGSGLLRGNNNYWWTRFRRLDVRCVRGPLTRETLLRCGYLCPECYGDPAVLMPLIYMPDVTMKDSDYLVVQHFSCAHQSSSNSLSPLTDNWKNFIDRIVKTKLVISSSLHGIILAEAYGIPAILLRHDMNMFKYNDYYYSTGRKDFPIAASVEEALQMQPAPLPDLKPLQEALISSFPKDLWAD